LYHHQVESLTTLNAKASFSLPVQNVATTTVLFLVFEHLPAIKSEMWKLPLIFVRNQKCTKMTYLLFREYVFLIRNL